MSYGNISLTLVSSAEVYCVKILNKEKENEAADKTAPSHCRVAASITKDISARQNNRYTDRTNL